MDIFGGIWSAIIPYVISIGVMGTLMFFKTTLRVLFYRSRKKKSTKIAPDTLWHIIWIFIIFGFGFVALAFWQGLDGSETTETIDPSTRRIVSGVTIIAYLLFLKSLLWRFIKDWGLIKELEKSDTESKLLRRIWFTIWVVIFFSVGIIHLSDSFRNLGISAVVVGGIIGISCQTPLRGIVGWLMLTMGSNFQEGDNVKIGNIKGKIERITLLSVVIKNADRNEVHIPTSTLFDQAIIDLSTEKDSKTKETGTS